MAEEEDIIIEEKPRSKAKAPSPKSPNHDFQARQISGKSPSGQYILAVVAKRTYQIQKDGRCVQAAETKPLVEELHYYPDLSDVLQQDIDLYAYKPFTDVVIQGHAYAPRSVSQFDVDIQVGKWKTSMLVLGDRQLSMSRSGMLKFSEPAQVEKVPLRYDFAYGGIDQVAERQFQLPPEEYVKHLPPEINLIDGSPYRYPRNPAGKGYLIEATEESVAMTQLPNLEDPDHRLLPDRLALGNTERWLEMPLPRATDWVNPAWFPRVAYFGFFQLPSHIPNRVHEIEKDWADQILLRTGSYAERFSFRCTNGASLGLQLPYLVGHERISMTHLFPGLPRFEFKLPGQPPELWVDGRKGHMKEAIPTLQSVVIRPDEFEVDLIWCGSAVAIRPYFEAELSKMPFEVKWD